jgi:asparagine synthase (glutamine-hydrolysing)
LCGIAGILRLDGGEVDPKPLGEMLAEIRHRGPDDTGTWHQGACALGHVRLSVLDLSAHAHQPMHSADGAGTLVYNGEVYNFVELRRELEAQGARFSSSGDAQVVLEALHRWGPERAVPRFDGMFALAYRDARDGSVWLARDRLGIKPLAWARRGDSVLFCSEVKGLLRHPAVPCRPSRTQLELMLLLAHWDRRRSFFEEVEHVSPGSLLRMRGREITAQHYFELPRDLDLARLGDPRHPTPAEAVRAFEDALARSVHIHQRSDAPLAAMCSGGVDSSLITALARRDRPDLHGYVADVGGAESEHARAQQVGRHLGVPVRRVPLEREDFLALWPRAVWHRDGPSPHPSDVAMLAVAERCRRDGIKVLLTGEGADELFGGYRWYGETYREWRRAHRRSRWLGRIHRPFRRAWHHLRRSPHAGVPGHPDQLLAQRLGAALEPERLLLRRALHSAVGRAVAPEERAFLVYGLDELHYTLASLLVRHDRIGMAASIESRVPFLGNEVIDLGLHLPARVKWRRGQGKWVVKKAAQRLLPRDVVYAPKRAFPVDPGLHRGSTALLRGGHVAELLGWTRAETEALLPLLEQDARTAYQFTSTELWARLYLGGESVESLGERLRALPDGGKRS